jgi:hypothetical protein
MTATEASESRMEPYIPGKTINLEHRYFHELQQKGIVTSEIRHIDNPMAGVLFRETKTDKPPTNVNLLSVGGFNSELHTTILTNGAIFEELRGEVDAVLGLNGNVTLDTLQNRSYNSDPEVQALYCRYVHENIPQERRRRNETYQNDWVFNGRRFRTTCCPDADAKRIHY